MYGIIQETMLGKRFQHGAWYAILWAFEVVAVVAVVLLLMLPIQDYARREHLEWYLHPSTETLRAFQTKQREEFLVRVGIAAPIATAAFFLALPLLRLRSKRRKSAGTSHGF